MQVTVTFYSYFRDLTGQTQLNESCPAGTTLHELFQALARRYPRLAAMEKSTLMAVGVEYQPRDYVLKEGDQVSFFPPVQGG